MHRLHPLADGEPLDGRRRHQHQQQRLCSAFLEGASISRGQRLPRPDGALLARGTQLAATLLKNRAASPASRLWHAFMAGAHAALADAAAGAAAKRAPTIVTRAAERPATMPAVEPEPLQLFVRQPFTESSQEQQALIAQVLGQIDRHNGNPYSFRYLTGTQAESADTFRRSFEAATGQAFTPRAFRAHRLGLLAQAQAFVNIRVGMSESSAFELCYHIFKGACTPVLFLVWKHAPIKTTLLKDLGNLCDITYLEFERADELQDGMAEFFHRHRAARSAPARAQRPSTHS